MGRREREVERWSLRIRGIPVVSRGTEKPCTWAWRPRESVSRRETDLLCREPARARAARIEARATSIRPPAINRYCTLHAARRSLDPRVTEPRVDGSRRSDYIFVSYLKILECIYIYICRCGIVILFQCNINIFLNRCVIIFERVNEIHVASLPEKCNPDRGEQTRGDRVNCPKRNLSKGWKKKGPHAHWVCGLDAEERSANEYWCCARLQPRSMH